MPNYTLSKYVLVMWESALCQSSGQAQILVDDNAGVRITARRHARYACEEPVCTPQSREFISKLKVD